jgi:hypothetical protein
MIEETIPEETAITALCVWEEMLRLHETEEDEKLNNLWENEGVCEMRVHALTIAKWIDEVFDLVAEKDRYGYCFGLEFVPTLIGEVVWLETTIELPDVKETADVIINVSKQMEQDHA